MAATIRDIKKRTGLSLATISKYLNGGNVLPENRILIEEAINELHYEVNELARGLVTHKTKTIGVLVYDIQCLFVGSMLHYLGMELHKKGYGMLICDSCNDEKLQKENLQFLLSRKVDGIFMLRKKQMFRLFWLTDHSRMKNMIALRLITGQQSIVQRIN